MKLETFIPLIIVFLLGAISPGPSLLIVTRNTMTKGTKSGIATALGHGLGFGMYCFVVMNLYKIILNSFPNMMIFLQTAGLLLLVYFSIIFLRDKTSQEKDVITFEKRSFIEGFLIAIINPKILIWMIAIFSPFINSNISLGNIIFISALGITIDSSWYLIVSILLGKNKTKITNKLNPEKLNRIMGIIMLFFGIILFFGMIS
ncbi:MAG: LysE family translocator [Dehalococcoidia bacterium]